MQADKSLPYRGLRDTKLLGDASFDELLSGLELTSDNVVKQLLVDTPLELSGNDGFSSSRHFTNVSGGSGPQPSAVLTSDCRIRTLSNRI